MHLNFSGLKNFKMNERVWQGEQMKSFKIIVALNLRHIPAFLFILTFWSRRQALVLSFS